MLELLISILMSLGIHFTVLDGGKIGITSKDMATLNSSPVYHDSGADKSCYEVVITDGADPSAESKDRE